MISVIMPSRSRPKKAAQTYLRWLHYAAMPDDWEWILSLDDNDESNYLKEFHNIGFNPDSILYRKNRSCVDAINHAANIAQGNILLVVSDDTEPAQFWDQILLDELDDKSDYLLKTDDGVQEYIVTMTVMDRKYYERDGYIYHPDFKHQFADTYLTCVADIRGRLIKSPLKFPHNHYSITKEQPDELHKRNDETWRDGQKTFVRLMKQFTPEERARITNKSMQGFMRFAGI